MRRPPLVAGGLLGVVALVFLSLSLVLVGPPTAASAPTTTTPAAGSGDWTVYHGDAAGQGVASQAGPIGTNAAWTSARLDGQLYGQPLVASGRVYVATENDTVVALDAGTGRTAWTAHLGVAVPASRLPCGNIQPSVGITGTPVLDASRDELFVVADELVRGAPSHLLVGLDATTGAVELDQAVDPPGDDTAALLQRTGLTLDGGRVVFGFGGNYGDCGHYHGWVVSVAETGGTPLRFQLDSGPGQREGAVWMGGAAPVVDGTGNIWVTVGNGSVTSSSGPYDNSDSVLELSPSLTMVQFFAPRSWAADNAADLDLSVAPALLGDGLVVATGKSQTIYLLGGSHLGGIGGQLARLDTGCGNDIDGGVAILGSTVYVPCLDGPMAVGVTATPPGLRVLWRATVGGGPPIVAGGLVWTIGTGDGVLYGLDPSTGQVRQQADLGIPANHFPTPGVGGGLLVASSADQVRAFPSNPSTAPTSTSPPATSSSVPDTRASVAAAASGGASPGVLAALAAVGAVVVGLALWGAIRWRRRGHPSGT